MLVPATSVGPKLEPFGMPLLGLGSLMNAQSSLITEPTLYDIFLSTRRTTPVLADNDLLCEKSNLYTGDDVPLSTGLIQSASDTT